MKKCIKALALLMMLGLSLQVSAADQTFNRYIQKGDKGDDVILLQKVLNADPDTKVATTGSGSPGNEINYYGELTKQAVIKLQKKNDLGTQYGLFKIYSGALDDKTRAFLNNYLKNKDIQATIAASTASSSSAVYCDRTVDDKGLATKFNPMNAFATMTQKIQTIGSLLSPSNIGKSSIADKLQAMNTILQTERPVSTTTPFIRSVELVNTGNGFLPSFTTLPSGGTLKITGCNFSTTTANTIHLMYNDQKATSTDGKTIIFTPKVGLQDLFNNGFTQALDNIKDPLTKAVEEELRQHTLQKMMEGMQYGQKGSTDTPCKDDNSDQLSKIIKDNVKDPKKLKEMMEQFEKDKKANSNNKKANDKACDDYNKKVAASSTAAQQLPGSPLFITVENDKGEISNGYQFYYQLK